MSFETWKQEYYTFAADSEEAKNNPIQHSLTKWIGLRKENLKKHDVWLETSNVFSNTKSVIVCDSTGDGLGVNHLSCSLCANFSCEACPLTAARDGTSCDDETEEEIYNKKDSPWLTFINSNNPEPMICWLQIALEENR